MQDSKTAPDGLTLAGPDFAIGPASLTRHDGKLYSIRTCADFVGGRWECFVSIMPVRR